jgi:oligosaccharide repeat unit polymerase
MIIFAFIFYILLVVLSVVITKDKYNMFLLSNIIFLTTTFLFPFLGTLLDLDINMSVEGMIMYIFYFAVFFIFYLIGRKSVNNSYTPAIHSQSSSFYIKLLLVVSLTVNIIFVLYSVATYGVQGAFISPREIYSVTRTGTGQIYIIASIFFNLYIMLGLFVYKRKFLHALFCVFLGLPYGTKGKFFFIMIYFLVYYFFVSKHKVKLRNPFYFITIISMVLIIMFCAFWYTSIGLDQSQILKFAVGYGNEYENNFHDLINHFKTYFPHGYFHGEILFGNSIYPYIPRVFWPGKPLYYGDLYLAYIVYPTESINNTGAPSFGPIGQCYADFGFAGGMIQIFIEQMFLGYLLGRYEIKCLKNPTIVNYVLLITLAFGGVIILASTDKVLLTLINLMVIIILFWPSRFNFKLRSTKHTQISDQSIRD